MPNSLTTFISYHTRRKNESHIESRGSQYESTFVAESPEPGRTQTTVDREQT